MAEEILIAVIFVKFQRHIVQLCRIQVNLLAKEEMGSVLIFFFPSICSKVLLVLRFNIDKAEQPDLRIEGN